MLTFLNPKQTSDHFRRMPDNEGDVLQSLGSGNKTKFSTKSYETLQSKNIQWQKDLSWDFWESNGSLKITLLRMEPNNYSTMRSQWMDQFFKNSFLIKERIGLPTSAPYNSSMGEDKKTVEGFRALGTKGSSWIGIIKRH